MVGTPLDFDVVMDLCGDGHRRIVLAVLAERDRPIAIDDLVNAIVTHNHHAPLAALSDETETQIRMSLHHAHLPKLEAVDLVDYDPDREQVTPTAQFDRVEPHLSRILAADPDLTPSIEA